MEKQEKYSKTQDNRGKSRKTGENRKPEKNREKQRKTQENSRIQEKKGEKGNFKKYYVFGTYHGVLKKNTDISVISFAVT